MSDSILLCTVGGSHQPILKAIEQHKPACVHFFCTDKDPESGKPGSITQVTGEGKCIKAAPGDEKPTLPNIPTQSGLGKSQFTYSLIPADDLDSAWSEIYTTIDRIKEQHPGVPLIADYTGGTKTMSAALVYAALERDDVHLHLVTGARSDLSRVAAGTEQGMMASVDRMRLHRAMKPHLNAWSRFAYREAAEGLANIPPIQVNAAGKTQLSRARNLSQAFALWDAFDHKGALKLAEHYKSQLARCYPGVIPALCLLTKEDAKSKPMLLFDLWRNAQRRAVQRRYDDAVARVYRLLEWTAQWQLRCRLDVDTADFPRERLPSDMAIHTGQDGKCRLGLWSAWQVIKADADMAGAAQQFIQTQEDKLKDLLNIRNSSILAHGFQPVRDADWQKMQRWMEGHFLGLLRELASEIGLKKPLEQLPTEFRTEPQA